MSHPHKTDAGDTPQACQYAALGIVGVSSDPRAAEINAQRLIGKRVVLANREQPRTGTVQSISHGVNATVAVRFDTDSYDTHLPPSDLKAAA